MSWVRSDGRVYVHRRKNIFPANSGLRHSKHGIMVTNTGFEVSQF